MLTLEQIEWVERLWKSKPRPTRVEIQRLTGIHRDTITTLIRKGFPKRIAKSKQEQLGIGVLNGHTPLMDYVRCVCGHKVILPCQICKARADRERLKSL